MCVPGSTAPARNFGRDKSSGKQQLPHRVKDPRPTEYFEAVAIDGSHRVVAAALAAGRSMKPNRVTFGKYVGWNLLINTWVEI